MGSLGSCNEMDKAQELEVKVQGCQLKLECAEALFLVVCDSFMNEL